MEPTLLATDHTQPQPSAQVRWSHLATEYQARRLAWTEPPGLPPATWRVRLGEKLVTRFPPPDKLLGTFRAILGQIRAGEAVTRDLPLRRLCELVGVTDERTVRRYLAALVVLGRVEVLPRPGHASRYRILIGWRDGSSAPAAARTDIAAPPPEPTPEPLERQELRHAYASELERRHGVSAYAEPRPDPQTGRSAWDELAAVVDRLARELERPRSQIARDLVRDYMAREGWDGRLRIERHPITWIRPHLASLEQACRGRGRQSAPAPAAPPPTAAAPRACLACGGSPTDRAEVCLRCRQGTRRSIAGILGRLVSHGNGK